MTEFQLDDGRPTIALLTATISPDCGTYTVALYVATVPSSVHETEPPTMPVPDDAACAVARTTAATDDSTGELHTEDDTEPDGTEKDTIVVSTVVVAGPVELDTLSEGVRESEALSDGVALSDGADDDLDGDIDAVSERDTLLDTLDVRDALRLSDTLGDDERLLHCWLPSPHTLLKLDGSETTKYCG